MFLVQSLLVASLIPSLLPLLQLLLPQSFLSGLQIIPEHRAGHARIGLFPANGFKFRDRDLIQSLSVHSQPAWRTLRLWGPRIPLLRYKYCLLVALVKLILFSLLIAYVAHDVREHVIGPLLQLI
jgi:hypothetical protein